MAVLEAMAGGCAVVAATEPISNAHLLADGRGIAVPANNVEQTAQALVQLVNDLPLCHRMGRLAREHVAVHHSPAKFRRTLQRVVGVGRAGTSPVPAV
jgi:glycosyltransferase involved in cell wall biosynthesis